MDEVVIGAGYTDLEVIVNRSGRTITKGRDVKTGGLVVIKVLDLLQCPSLMREWRLATVFKLPHTLPVTRLEVPFPHAILVFPFIEAGPCYPTSWQQWIHILLQLFETLIPLHANKYAHLDLNPSNILLEPNGAIWVIDFGLAEREDIPPDSQHPTSPIPSPFPSSCPSEPDNYGWAGTLPYVDPHLIQTGHVTTATDMWSVGVMVAQSIFKEEFFSYPYTATSVLAEAVGLPTWIQQAIVDPNLHRPLLYHDTLATLVADLLQLDSTQRLDARTAYTRLKQAITPH